MARDPRPTRHRRSIRLPEYNYAQPGSYFVTIVQHRSCLFGNIVSGEMELNDAGLTVQSWWNDLPRAFLGVRLDAFVVMPNHFHGIVLLGTDSDSPPAVSPHPRGGACDEGSHAGLPLHLDLDDGRRPPPADRGGDDRRNNPAVGAARRGCPASLSDVIGWYKTMTTNDYIRGVKGWGWPPFPGRLWQRNYFEHVVRSDRSLNQIRAYIEANPARWLDDEENPATISPT